MNRKMRIGLSREFPLAGLLLLSVFPPAAPLGAETELVGTPWVGALGVQESTAAIMRRTGDREGRVEAEVLKPRLAAETRNLSPNPESPESRGGFSTSPLSPKAGNPGSPITVKAQSIGITFTGATLTDASGFPPDSMGAAGPSQFLIVINGRVRTFSKLTGARDGVLNSATVFVLRQNSLFSGGSIVATAFRSLIKKMQGFSTGPYSPQGVDNYDPAAVEGYVIGVDTSVLGRLDLRRISDPGGTPSISGNISITTATTSNPINVPHLGNTGGNSGYLDGLDNRLLAAHVRNGRLWTTQNIGVNNAGSTTGTFTRNAVRWYELQGIATGQTPGVFQSGTLFQPSSSNTFDQRNYWMGTIMVSGQGHTAMGFSSAGADTY